MRKTAPPPSRADTAIDPPCAVTIAFADGQSQADAAPRRLVMHAIELVEDLVFFSSRNAEAAIRDRDHDTVADRAGRDIDRSACRRVLGGILEQIGEDLLDEHRVNVDQRQVVRKVHRDAALREDIVQASQARRRPVPPARTTAATMPLTRFHPRHVEQIVDQHGHASRLVVDRGRELLLRGGRQLRLRIDQARRRADQDRQRRAQVVRDGVEQRIAQALGLRAAGVFRRIRGELRRARSRPRAGPRTFPAGGAAPERPIARRPKAGRRARRRAYGRRPAAGTPRRRRAACRCPVPAATRLAKTQRAMPRSAPCSDP